MRKSVLAQIVLLTITLTGSTALAAEDVIYLSAGALIDTIKGEKVTNPLVEIKGDRIVSVREGGSPPDGANLIDLGDATILPGLADMHTHLTYYDTDFGMETLALSATDFAIRGVVNARRALMAGFTAGRDLGAEGFADVALRNAINDGHIPGPRLQVSGPALSATGGHCDNNWLSSEFDATGAGVADGPWAARAKVRENRKYGADVIKVCATGGVLSKGTDPGARQITFEELEAIVDEAHMLGMKVAAHAHGTEGILFAIRAGIDSIEHSSLIDDEGLKLARRNGTFLSINAYTPVFMRDNGESLGIPADSLRRARNMAGKRLDRYRAAIEADARIVFGSDTSTYPHGDHAKQFSVYVDLGMTPMEAIQSATVIAAESLGWVGDTGAVAAGYFADIIAVDGDPLEDISALENVKFVMKGGEVFKSSTDSRYAARHWPSKPSPQSVEMEKLPQPYYSVLWENEHIRIVEHTMAPGDSEPMHTHPEMLAYVMENSSLLVTEADGTTSEIELTKGDFQQLPSWTHSIQNVGDTPLHTLLVELKP